MIAIRNSIQPISTEKPVLYGLDLEKSVDYTTLIGLDKQRHVCVLERFQKTGNETIESIRHIVVITPTLVDSSGIGDAVLESLQNDDRRNFEGLKFTQGTKQQLC